MFTLAALSENNYRKFVTGFGISYVLYWVTLLSVGWWTWEQTHSAFWVSLMFFCDLFPALILTPFASSFADRGDRFLILRIVLWVQVLTGIALSMTAYFEILTPTMLAIFIFVEGALIGISQPAFFGLINRLVSEENLSSAVAFNHGLVQTTYIIGPLVASLVFSFGMEYAWVAFGANGVGTFIYLLFLNSLTLRNVDRAVAPSKESSWMDTLDGIKIFFTNKLVYQASIVILVFSLIQRPVVNLLPAVNGEYGVLAPAYFAILTAAFMLGSVIASLYLSSLNSDTGVDSQRGKLIAGLSLSIIVLFVGMEQGLTHVVFVATMLAVIGGLISLVYTSCNIVLQNSIDEHYRSRVLGNSYMITRAVGAFSVVLVGIGIEAYGMQISYVFLALFSLAMYKVMMARHFG